MPNQELWLIRTAQNELSRPCTREVLCAKIAAGELKQQDEICRANSYWIYLHESEELFKQLGIAFPKDADEEITETETASQGALPRPVQPLSPSTYGSVESGSSFGNGDRSPGVQRVKPFVQVYGRMERPSMWQGFAWVLVAALLVLVYLVLRTLRAGI